MEIQRGTHESWVAKYGTHFRAECSCGWTKWAKTGKKAAEKMARKHVEVGKVIAR